MWVFTPRCRYLDASGHRDVVGSALHAPAGSRQAPVATRGRTHHQFDLIDHRFAAFRDRRTARLAATDLGIALTFYERERARGQDSN